MASIVVSKSTGLGSNPGTPAIAVCDWNGIQCRLKPGSRDKRGLGVRVPSDR